MRLDWRALFDQKRILGGATVLAVTQFGASLAGLVRDNVLAGTFQARGEVGVVDAYLAAFRPSDFLFQVFIMSAIGTVLVPMLAGHRESGRKDELERLLGGAIGTGALFFGGIALLLAIVFPYIAPYLVQFQGEQLRIYVTFARIALLTNFLFIFGNAYGQYLITVQRYWIYGLTPILYTVGTIAGTVFLTPQFGALGPILGTLGGAIVYVLLRAAGVLLSGTNLRLQLWHREVGEMGILMLPRMAALGAMQLQLLFFDGFASGLDAGSVMVNSYARNFQSVIVGVAGIAVAQSAFALMSQAAARGERQRFVVYVRKGIGILLVLTIPGSLLLAFLAPVGAFLVHITAFLPLFAATLWAYAISIPFESCNHLLLRAYYATKHTFVPSVAMVAGGITAVAGAWVFLPRLGVQGLGVGYAIGAVVTTIILALLLPRRIRSIAAQ
ncbi:MAG: lipid II flippase MurJ [Candidatus Peribacteraceae bacterium]